MSPVTDETTGENPPPPPETVSLTDDGRVSPAIPAESIIDDWDQLLSTMENAALVQFDPQTGIMMFEPSDTDATTAAALFSVDSRPAADDATDAGSEYPSTVAEDVTVCDSISECTIDS